MLLQDTSQQQFQTKDSLEYFAINSTDKTRPEVSKLTPETRRNSPVAKLGPSESSEVTNRLTDKQKLCNNFKPLIKMSMKYFSEECIN